MCGCLPRRQRGDVVRSAAGCADDIFHYNKTSFGVQHDGMKFTTLDMDNDVAGGNNCAVLYGGGWWWHKCGIFAFTAVNPAWYCLPPEDSYYATKSIHVMIKLQ